MAARPSAAAESLVLVGGGLQNALVALAALEARPSVRIVMLERGVRPGGNHTWSFHATDVPGGLHRVLDELAEHRWPGYDVRFPGGRRTLGLGYESFSSARLADVLEARLAAAPNAELRVGAEVVAVDSRGATLEGGERVEGALVVDARGPARDAGARTGFQKFYGVELELEAPHGLERPLVMDATVEQVDGFRFLYVLPLGLTRLLVEDTVFSGNAELDAPVWRERALREAAARGWLPAEVVREEEGVLPMPWGGGGPAYLRTGPLVAGYAGGFFHPATGFSVPVAARLALELARHLDAPHRFFDSGRYRRLVSREQAQHRFARFLNRLLFTGVAPEDRWTVFERFYRLPEPVIARFYACATRATDRARLLVGRPPRGFSLRGALAGRSVA